MADLPFSQQDMPVRLKDEDGNDFGVDAQPFVTEVIDPAGASKLKINADGSLNVNTALPTPAAALSITVLVRGTVSGSSLIDTPWIVPNNTTFYLQRFRCGGDGAAGDRTRFFLYHNTTGVAVTVVSALKAIVYYNGYVSDYGADLAEAVVGDGVQAYVMRRERNNATARELFALISGYLTYATITTDESNTATTVTARTLTRTAAGWTTNQWVGKYLRVAGGPPQYIISNTSTVITVAGNIDNIGSTIPYTITTFNP